MWWVTAIIGLLYVYHRWYMRASGLVAGGPVFAPAVEGAISAASVLALLLPVFYLGTWAWRALFRRWPAPGPPGSPTSARDYVRFRTAAVVVGVLFVASLATTVSLDVLGIRLFQRSGSALVASVPDAQVSEEAKREWMDLIGRVVADPDSLPEVKPRYWQLLKEQGKDTPSFIEECQTFIPMGLRYNELLWEDAAVALRTGKPLKSPERERLEEELIRADGMDEQQRAADDAMIADIAAGEPVCIAQDPETVVTADYIERMIAAAPRKRAAMEELLTPPGDVPAR
jgi:hypothetical protein